MARGGIASKRTRTALCTGTQVRTRRPAVLALRTAWVAIVLWYEIGVFVRAVRSCPWPDERRALTPDSRLTRVLIVADPQVLDDNSYLDRHPLLARLTRVVVDVYLRKSWRAAVRVLRPHAVVFLGDMMDNGRAVMSPAEYDAYYERFRHIFKMHGEPVPVYYVPGNHDIGIGDSFALEAPARYTSSFGARNHRVGIANHTLLFLDGPALVDEDIARVSAGKSLDEWPAVRRGPVEFVRAQTQERDHPVVLFSHVPLARDQNVWCGRFREHRANIRQGAGLGYQNTLGREVSSWVLERLRPAIIFSGDDHDYCEVRHTYTYTDASSNTTREEIVPEVTVKSFSMVTGVRRPGYQLLSLAARVPEPELLPQIPQAPPPAHAPCTLPDQLGIYVLTYVPLAVLSVLVLVVVNVQRVRRRYRKREWGRRDSAKDGLRSGYWEPERRETPLPHGDRKRRMEGGRGRERDVEELELDDLVFVNPDADTVEEPPDEVERFKLVARRATAASEQGVSGFYGGHGRGAGFQPTSEEEEGLEAEMDVLPEPATNVKNRNRSGNGRFSRSSRWPRWTWTFVLRGQVRRVSVPWPFGCCARGTGAGSRRRWIMQQVRDSGEDERGFVGGLVRDVRDVAWPAIVVFLVVNWVVMW
ncbi:Metallo-dependent phosphatase [Coniophora puteana RWD-64-598 SS2]|uniref:Metallo-dependent phosphatase n=1 Tax=Coniophora puteana (strain RWD-64-598) TaxID=741705 RepID=A0A5M3MUQ3_CONPW|nr:Metallo-dependent phosphatase [Coniophora puteana RWD-64-598 SS2]EIW82717.1 Metallo-dependent phosphatase [Coniophora puteana RWD-64-598 SS2]